MADHRSRDATWLRPIDGDDIKAQYHSDHGGRLSRR